MRNRENILEKAKVHRARKKQTVFYPPVEEGTLICAKCEREQDVSEFTTDRYRKTGRKTHCRNCVAGVFKTYMTTDRYSQRIAAYKAKRHDLKHTNPKMRWAKDAKNASVMRAGKAGLEHELTVAWLYESAPEVCPLLGISLRYDGERSGSDSAAVDRKDNTLGYTRENSWVISMKANRIKTNATTAEVEKVAESMRRLGLP